MSRRHSGLGLGMAIVRHLVELHGGTVSVESDGENQGTTFRLRLSRHAGAAPEVADSPSFAPRRTTRSEVELEHLNGVHVLIVEDDTDSRNVLAVLLQRLGALVEAVASAKEAFDRVSHRRPDVLVSDIGMPDEDGYSLIRRVRQIGRRAKAAGDCADRVCAQAGRRRGARRRLRPPPAEAGRARRPDRAIKSVTLEITNNK